MKSWRTVEVLGCIALLMFIVVTFLRVPVCHAIEEAFARAAKSDVQAFLDGKTDTYRGFDYAGLQGY